MFYILVRYIMYTVLHSTMFYTVHNVPAVLYCTVQCTCILYSFVVCPVIPFLWLTVGLIIDMCNNGKIYVLYSYMPTLFFTAMLKGL